MSTSGKNRILFLVGAMPAIPDGGESRLILDLAKALGGPNDVRILAPSYVGAPKETNLDGVQVKYYRHWYRSGEDIAYPGPILPKLKADRWNYIKAASFCLNLVRALGHELRTFRPQLVHAFGLSPHGLVAALICRKVPLFLTLHTDDVFTQNQGRILRLKQLALRRAFHRIVGSPECLTELHKLVDCNLHSSYIAQGFNPQSFGPHLRSEPNHVCRLLYVGRIIEKKGLIVLLQAMATMREQSWELDLVGLAEPGYLWSLEDIITTHGLEHRVHFLGPKTHAELGRIYANADIFCYPAIVTPEGDREGVPAALIEAAASGLPLVGSDCGGIREIIKAYNGFLAMPGIPEQMAAAIQPLLQNSALRRVMGKASLGVAAEFSWPKISSAYALLYADALNRGTNP